MNMLQFRNKAFKDRTGDMVMTVGANTTLPGTRGGQTEGGVNDGTSGLTACGSGQKRPLHTEQTAPPLTFQC